MIKINLLPLELQRKAKELFNVWYLMIIPVLVILVCIPFYISALNQINQTKAEIEEINKKLEQYKDVREKLKQVEDEIKGIEVKIEFIKDKKNRQKFWSEVLDKLSAIMPVDVWLESLSVSQDGTITMSGGTVSFESVGNFIRSLNNSQYFRGAKLSGGVSKVYEGTPETQQTEKVSFSITCTYIPPAEGKTAEKKQ
jgi:Tfp pilus assembly protein PilN